MNGSAVSDQASRLLEELSLKCRALPQSASLDMACWTQLRSTYKELTTQLAGDSSSINWISACRLLSQGNHRQSSLSATWQHPAFAQCHDGESCRFCTSGNLYGCMLKCSQAQPDPVWETEEGGMAIGHYFPLWGFQLSPHSHLILAIHLSASHLFISSISCLINLIDPIWLGPVTSQM